MGTIDQRRVAAHEAGHLLAAYAADLHPYEASIAPSGDGTGGRVRYRDCALDALLGYLGPAAGIAAVRLRLRVALAGRAAEDLLLGRPRIPMRRRMHERGERPDRDLVSAVDLAFRIRAHVAEVERLLDAEDRFVRGWLVEQWHHVEYFAGRLLLEATIRVGAWEGRKVPKWPGSVVRCRT